MVQYELNIVKEITSIVNTAEPEIAYQFKKGKIKSYDDFFSNKLLMIFIIRNGVTTSLFESIAALAPFSMIQWAGFLDISLKSLQRYKKKDHQFKPIQSEKIIELAEVTHKGVDVFGSSVKFESWLNAPSFALGNIKPMEWF